MNLIKYILIGLTYGRFCASTKFIFPAYIGEFFSSIAMWTFVVVFFCRKIKTKLNAIICSLATMIGIFIGYYIGLSWGAFSFYDYFWIFIASVFSCILGYIIYLDNKIYKIQNIFIPCTFLSEAFWKMTSRRFYMFWKELLDCPLLIVSGIILFIYYNYGNLNDLKLYVKFVLFTLVEILGLYFIYGMLHWCI